MAGNRRGDPDRKSVEMGCEDVAHLYTAFCEGSLGVELAHMVGRHVATCAACRELVFGFRAFLEHSSATDLLPERDGETVASTAATHLARWTALLKSWLDVIYPASVPAVVYRGGQQAQPAKREAEARRRSERPFLIARDKRVQIVVHRARGKLLGRVDDSSGLPLFPVLVGLDSSRNGGHVLNRLDGTFTTDWDPEATGIVCWTPMGGKSLFPFDSSPHDGASTE